MKLKDLRLDDAARIVAHALSTEAQGGQEVDQPVVHRLQIEQVVRPCLISPALVDCDSFLSSVRRYRLVRPGSVPSSEGMA